MCNANVLYSPPEPLWFLILEKLVKTGRHRTSFRHVCKYSGHISSHLVCICRLCQVNQPGSQGWNNNSIFMAVPGQAGSVFSNILIYKSIQSRERT
jgi:hypothetical protein